MGLLRFIRDVSGRSCGLVSNRSSHQQRAFSCKAVVLPRFGAPDVLQIRSNEKLPELGSKDVLVATKAAAVNPLDVRMREGYGRSLFEPLLPLILGRDVSGEVIAVGNSVKQLHVGQEVFGALHPTAVRGTYSDYSILEEDQLVVKPSSLSHMEAAAIPFAALTAWRALKGTAEIKKGQRVLVLGGGGAVGLAAIQLAKAAGCQVTSTCGKRSMDRAVEAGAEHTVDYTSENLKDKLGGRFDAILDTIGVQETEALGVSCLKRGGHYMTLQGEAVNYADKLGLVAGGAAAAAVLLKKQVQYRQAYGIEYAWTIMRTDSEALQDIAMLVRNGKLKIPVGKVFSLWEAAQAHYCQERKQAHGKVVLHLD
ncbi:hypothetical protein GOP47_0015396 [Adiantum capillus-veneris]|uniref:Enoyl reductase (ER) domain-containing protein n=1 Tax=Adiantum capillus-veneris TaxID=13818 RepID=A0A9D4UJP9_ADICA|nr:hypothetical protein GOP47_0015396 [Adiantum capillus-veneris]